MSFALNCLFLGETSFEKIFQIAVPDMIFVDNAYIPINEAQVGQLKSHIWSTKRTKFNIDDSDNMNLYRVDVDDESELIGVFFLQILLTSCYELNHVYINKEFGRKGYTLYQAWCMVNKKVLFYQDRHH